MKTVVSTKRTASAKVDVQPASAPSILDPRWLVFVCVADLGSLSKAAIALDMPQSLVSRNIALLEQQCGERLFRRTGRGVGFRRNSGGWYAAGPYRMM